MVDTVKAVKKPRAAAKKSKSPVRAKKRATPASAKDSSQDAALEIEAAAEVRTSADAPGESLDTAREKPAAAPLQISLSESLQKKLARQASEEGISTEEFISELLAESVVLRAWEIVERKNQMRGPSGNSNHSGNSRSSGNSNHNNQSNHNNRNNNNRGQNKHRGGMSQGRYQSIMDDKATFLEYVRNQERTRR